MLFRISLIVIISIITAFSTKAQTFSVKGKIVDNQEQPVPFANVAVYQVVDSLLITGTTSDEQGNFTINLTKGKYSIRISFLSYQDKVIFIEPASATSMGVIVLEPDTEVLQEIVVQGEKSSMELHLDKRVFNVSKDLSNLGSNASEILNNLPSVVVDVEGNVSLRGSQNVRILIDGKPSGLIGISGTDALRQMQGDLIESIEVITNPSSRYDAEGEVGIINIVLKKNVKKGVNGSFGSTLGYPANYGVSANINFRRKNLNWFLNYAYSYRSSPGSGSSYQEYYSVDTSFVYEQNIKRERSNHSNTVNGGVDYFFNDNSSVTASLLYRRSEGLTESIREYKDLENGLVTQTVIREETEHEPETNIEAAVNYKKNFKQKDRVLTADFKWLLNNELEQSDFTESNSSQEPSVMQRSSNTEDELNMLIQMDYIHPLNATSKWEAGMKSTIRNLSNDFVMEEQDEDSDWVVIGELDNRLIYKEHIYAAYGIYSQEWKRFSMQAGLRGELSDITTELVRTNEVNNRLYFNMFPSAYLSYKIKEQKTLQLSYSYRISRPGFRDLIPFSNFSDSRVFFSGNPDLNPEYTHSLESGYLVNGEKITLLANVYYRYRTGVIQRITEVDDSGLTLTTPVNLSTENAYGLEGNLTCNLTEWWRAALNANFYRAITEGDYKEQQLNSDTYTWNGRFTSRMTFFKELDFQMAFNYRAPRITTQGKDLSLYFIDVTLYKDVLKGKGSITAGVRDLLNSQKRRSITDYEGYYSKNEFQWRMRQFIMTFTYRLNQRKDAKSARNEMTESGGED